MLNLIPRSWLLIAASVAFASYTGFIYFNAYNSGSRASDRYWGKKIGILTAQNKILKERLEKVKNDVEAENRRLERELEDIRNSSAPKSGDGVSGKCDARDRFCKTRSRAAK